jgi:hypothetical protein
MGDAGGGAYHDRGIEFLAEIEGMGHEIVRFLAVAWLQHGHLGQLGVMAVILLSLRAVRPRVIGADDHQAGGDAGGGSGHERIAGDV